MFTLPRYLVLPYTILAANREKPFSEESEYTAAFCLAEAKRKKGGVLGGPIESLHIFAKLYYPIWVFPWKNKSLFVDGLGISSYGIRVDRSINASLWIEEVIKESRRRSRYINVLNRLFRACRRRRPQAQLLFKAVISEKNLLDFLLGHLRDDQVKKSIAEKPPPSLVGPLLNEKKAKKKVQLLIDRHAEALADMEGLRYLIKTLEEKTQFHVEKINSEIKELEEKYQYELAELKPKVEDKIKQFTTERDEEIKKITEAAEKKAERENKKKERLEKKLRKIEEQRERYKVRKEKQRIKKDDAGVRVWSLRIKESTRKILEVRRELRECKKNVEDIFASLRKDVEKINEIYDAKIKREEDRLEDIKKELEKAIIGKKEEIDTLKIKTESLIRLVKKQMDKVRDCITKLEAPATPRKRTETELLSVPFYFVQYKTDKGERYAFFPPAMVGDCKGIFSRIKRAIIGFSLEGRVNLLLQPQSDEFKELLITLENTLEKNRTLKGALIKAGEDNNTLAETVFRTMLVSGLEDLEAEGWINREEKTLILERYKIREKSTS